MKSLRGFSLACVISLLCAGAASAALGTFQIDANSIGAGVAVPGTVVPKGIDSAGNIVGSLRTPARPGNDHAFLWNGQTTLDLNLVANTSPIFNSVATSAGGGQVVGYNSSNVVFIYDIAAGTAIKPINGLAYATNGVGMIVGQAKNTLGVTSNQAFKFNGTSASQVYPPNGISTALGVNGRGDVVGFNTATTGQNIQAFVQPYYNASTQAPIYLPTLLPAGTWASSKANAVSSTGLVVGYFTNAGGTSYAFSYQVPSSGSTGPAPAALDPSQPSIAKSVNSSGMIVGQLTTLGHGFIYDGTSIVDLNSLLTQVQQDAGWVITDALAINDANQIAALFSQNGGPTVAMRVAFVPLPGSGMLGMGLLACVGGLGLVRRMRRAE